jgi:hypothetical protein
LREISAFAFGEEKSCQENNCGQAQRLPRGCNAPCNAKIADRTAELSLTVQGDCWETDRPYFFCSQGVVDVFLFLTSQWQVEGCRR